MNERGKREEREGGELYIRKKEVKNRLINKIKLITAQTVTDKKITSSNLENFLSTVTFTACQKLMRFIIKFKVFDSSKNLASTSCLTTRANNNKNKKTTRRLNHLADLYITCQISCTNIAHISPTPMKCHI